MRAALTKTIFSLALGAGCAALFAAGAYAADFKVPVNESKALHLATPAATVMIGNPAIADVTIENARLLYVMGRSYGTTNLIILNNEGKQVADMNVSVTSQSASAVTLTRGTGQLSYNCTPRCERVPVVGDSPDAFSSIMGQMSGTSGAGLSSAVTGAVGSVE